MGFVADVAESTGIATALAAARDHFGTIDVLEFSPHAGNMQSMFDPLDVTVDNLRPTVDTMLFGAVSAIQSVLPAMRKYDCGTILVTAGTGSIDPLPIFGTLNLHNKLADTNVYVVHVAIGVGIGETAPAEGYPFKTPAQLADIYWDLHSTRKAPELVVTG